MGAPDLLQHLHDSGLHLDVDGDFLIVKPSARLTEEMRQGIREFKPELLALLAGTKFPSSQSAWPRSSAATDDELDVMEARQALFRHRGVADAKADDLLDKLLISDREKAGLVTCLLCQNYSPRQKTCSNFRSASIGKELGTDIPVMLQRCAGYAF